jgi:hypothetical protein
MNERKIVARMQLALREAIERRLAKGWEIIKRDPLTLQRGKALVELRHGVLVNG